MAKCDMRAWSHDTRDDIVRCWTHKVMLYEGDTCEGFCPAGYREKLHELAKRSIPRPPPVPEPAPASAPPACLRCAGLPGAGVKHQPADPHCTEHWQHLARNIEVKTEDTQGALLADATLRIAASFALVDVGRGDRYTTPTVQQAADLAEDWYDECAGRGWLPAREVNE